MSYDLRQARINNIAPVIREAMEQGVTDPEQIAARVVDDMEARTLATLAELEKCR